MSVSFCTSLPSQIFPNPELCEWTATMQGITEGNLELLDTGSRYVDLTNPQEPITKRIPSDSKVSTEELHGVVATLAEEEWKANLKSGSKSLPISEHLYLRFGVLPPWLPKSWSQLNPAEKILLNNLIKAARKIYQNHRANFVLEFSKWLKKQITYQTKATGFENDLIASLKNKRANCVGLSNIVYFAGAIVNGLPLEFFEVYRAPDGSQMRHVTVSENDGRVVDVSTDEVLKPPPRWLPITRQDQWAYSLMDAKASETTFQRAHEMAPNNFRVQFNLGVTLYNNGNIKEGRGHLRRSYSLYPTFEPLWGWGDVIDD